MPRPESIESAERDFRRLPLCAEWLDTVFCEASVIQAHAEPLKRDSILRLVVDAHNRLRLSSFHLLRNTPGTRWANPEAECWDTSAIAVHVRTVMEGCIVFHYLTDPSLTPDESFARSLGIELCDLRSMHSLMGDTASAESRAKVEARIAEVIATIKNTETYKAMKPEGQKASIAPSKESAWGMLLSKDDALKRAEFDPPSFRKTWAYFSKFCHMLPESYRGLGDETRHLPKHDYEMGVALSASMLEGRCLAIHRERLRLGEQREEDIQ